MPLPLYALMDNQRQVYRQLADLLAEAVRDVTPEPDSQRQVDGAALDFNRKSRVAVVSGGRGTGKTTAVLSLVYDVSSGRGPVFHKPKPGEASPPETQDETKLREQVQALAGQLVWLPVLDMAPLPAAANLFTGVLVRIEDAVTRAMPQAAKGERPHSFLAGPDVYDAPLEKLRRLQTDVAVSWEGNLKERAAGLDPSAFAEEVKRAEAVRLKLNPRLAEVLDGFTAGFASARGRVSNPLFVLPVDDFDLNPPRCLELLELLRTLSVPRLFCVALGDVEVAEAMCTLQLAADVARVSGRATRANFLPLNEQDVQAKVANVSGNAIRKLLPPSQRIELLPLKLTQALDLRPAESRASDRTLRQLLEAIPVSTENLDWQIRRRFDFARPPTQNDSVSPLSVNHFLFARSPLHPQVPSREFYTARQFLELPVRQLVDFWQQALQVAGQPGEPAPSGQLLAERSRRFRLKMHEFCRDVFRAEETLPSEARRDVLAAFDGGPDANWSLLPEPFGLTSLTTRARVRQERRAIARVEVTPARPENVPIEWQVTSRISNGWEFRGPLSRQGKPIFLAQTTGYLLLFYTDLDALARGWGANNCLVDLKHTDFRPQLTYRFQDKTLPPLSWPAPPVLTFWEIDRFLSGWNDVLRSVDQAGKSDVLSFLILNWIALGADVLTGGSLLVRGYVQSPPSREDWLGLQRQVAALDSASTAASEVGAPVQRWIAEVLSLLNPDVIGQDSPAGGVFSESPSLRELCQARGKRFAEWGEADLRRDAASTETNDAFWRALRALPTWWGTAQQAAREGQRHYYF